MSKLSSSLVLIGTICFSSAVTFVLTKAKYDKKIFTNMKYDKNENKNVKDKGNIFNYTKKYKSNENIPEASVVPHTPIIEYVNSDVFDESEYDAVSYTMWADGVLTDENDEPMGVDIDDNIGSATIEKFEELAVNDSVYLLNHKQKIRYEILKDLRKYSETIDLNGTE